MHLAKIVDKTFEYGFYALFFFTPILFNPSRSFPSYELFEWNKMIFVYTVTTLIVATWLIRMVLARRIIFTKTPFLIPLLLFLGSQTLSTLFSIDRHVSLFGYYSRFHGGLVSTICYTLLYFAFVSNRSLISVKKLLSIALVSGTGIALYGIAEKFGIDAHMWVQDVQSRVFSTLGQPNWLAAYLVVLLPIAISFLLTALNYSSNERSEVRSFFNFFNVSSRLRLNNISLFATYYLLIATFYVCLLFTKSRSGFLGFWIANAVLWASVFYSSSEVRSFLKNLKESSPRLGGSNSIVKIFLILNAAFLITNFFIRTPFSQYNKFLTLDVFSGQHVETSIKPPTSGSIIDVGITDSADIRRIVWKGAWDIAQQYPLFGTGPETFAFAYYKFRPTEHNLTSEWDFLYNRAHNEFLNIAATSGFVGLGTYLFLIAVVIFYTVKQILKHPHNVVLTTALLAGFVSILVTNFFGFSVVIIGLFFFLIPAMVYTLIKPAPVEAVREPDFDTRTSLALLAILAGFGFFLVMIGNYWLSDSLYAQAYNLKRQNSYSEAHSLITQATQLRPDEPVYRDERAQIAAGLAEEALAAEDATQAASLAKEAINESSEALAISPQNVNFWKTRTRILYQLSVFDEAFTESALESIQVAQQLAPTDAKIAYNVAVILGDLGKTQEAIAMLERTVELKPDYRDAYIALAIFYEKEKDLDQARASLQKVLDRINPDDEEVTKRLEELK